MEEISRLRRAQISVQKVRLVADQIRGKSVAEAMNILRFSKKKAAAVLLKVLRAAIAGAEHNQGADVDDMHVATVCVDEGPVSRRWRPRARGRADRISKRTSHITLRLSNHSK